MAAPIDTANQTAKILIVDDTPSHLEIFSIILRQAGFQIITASDGLTALREASQFNPDLILLDVMLPELDGLETCRRLKANKATQAIPVIFSTALVDSADVVKGFEAGAVDYITKPPRHQEMLARINTHLTIHRLQKELKKHNEHLQQENTRRQRVQETLKESRERYRLLAENSTDIISRQTPDGVYLYVSPACKTMLGYEIEEMVGHAADEFVHSQDLAAIKETNNPDAEHAAAAVMIYRAHHKDNSYVWVETIHKLIRDPKTGKLLEIVAVTRNISERKQAQEALEQANVALAASNKDLETFARTVAHDLKNPLFIILGYCELWNYKDILPEELRPDVHKMRQAARKMNDIIESLLLLAGVRKAEIIPQSLDMAAIVAAAQERLGAMLVEYQAHLELPAAWPVARGYAPWIEEVWVNYLSNALKYGGHPPLVQLGAAVQPNNMVKFWAKDNGPGLTAEEQAKLFTPFTRVTQRPVEGHGLGLSIVQQIAEKLGGQAGVESDGLPGQGSKFYFTLPGYRE
jgi:PAS domain S-box-containing protein